MKESPADIIAAVSHGDVRLFRMQSGMYRALYNEQHVSVGVPGMSDTIGMVSRIVTPAMVGRRVAIYTAIEVKSATGHTARARRERQDAFIVMVREQGGIAGYARSVDDALKLIQGEFGHGL